MRSKIQKIIIDLSMTNQNIEPISKLRQLQQISHTLAKVVTASVGIILKIA